MPTQNHHFLTVDAESDVISEGIQAISAIRDEVERTVSIKVPITWFVRFQRTWTEYVNDDCPGYFEGPVTKAFDGFELAKPLLRKLRDNGDEVGWHYHAYSYVHHPELPHTAKMDILRADLVSCARDMKVRHPDFSIETFRFGWFFVPDYEIFHTLKEIGIRADASVNPASTGTVRNFQVNYLPPITRSKKKIDGMYFFPFSETLLIHDWNVVPHQLGWSSLDATDALLNRENFKNSLLETAAALRRQEGRFLTYEAFREQRLCEKVP